MYQNNKLDFKQVIVNNAKNTLVILYIVTLASCGILGPKKTNKMLHVNYVPDETTAIKIAEAVWLPIYGKEIYEEKPFKATLVKGVWIVGGALSNDGDTKNVGGSLYIEIQQSDCKVLRVLHTK